MVILLRVLKLFLFVPVLFFKDYKLFFVVPVLFFKDYLSSVLFLYYSLKFVSLYFYVLAGLYYVFLFIFFLLNFYSCDTAATGLWGENHIHMISPPPYGLVEMVCCVEMSKNLFIFL